MRAKMRCTAVTKTDNDLEQVALVPVYGKDGTANAQWSKWTPSGKLELSISNPEAHGQIKPGAEYFVDITEAPAEDAAPAKVEETKNDSPPAATEPKAGG